ncbi:MAG TPA: hypothetical protein VJG30_03110 [Candidatus Nanoarchaeia archaeon]|nr:hypothetical protein [Candidatus Nanoarchaeia archaeon]
MIQQEDVADLTLEQMLGDDEEGKSVFRCTKSLVGAFLFSRYELRRNFARWALSKIFTTPVDVHTIEEGEIIYAYIELNRIKKYILVQRYNANSPALENVPSENEKKLWLRAKKYPE